MFRFRGLVYLLAIVMVGLDAGAQQITGSIRGTVQDPSGAIVQSASVSARQTETGLTRTAITDPNGAYVLVELPVGHYELQVEAKGFRKYVQQGITLNVNETATIPIHLAVGPEGEVLEVNADAQLIQGTVTSLGKTVT
jgi:Carboxypeptidase regulatory-like domain